MALTNKLSAIGDAIREKTGTTELLKLDEMPSAIAGISSGGSKYQPRFISFREYDGTDLDSELENLDTSLLTTTRNMFYQNRSLVEVDLSNSDFSNVKYMDYMFYQCSALESVNLSGNNLSKVKSTAYMFHSCNYLENPNFSNVDTRDVESMAYMFYNNGRLTRLDLSSFETPMLADVSLMFSGCRRLTFIDMRKMTFDKVISYDKMFVSFSNNCLVVVKDDTQKEWITSRFNIANLTVKTVAEYQAEGGV